MKAIPNIVYRDWNGKNWSCTKMVPCKKECSSCNHLLLLGGKSDHNIMVEYPYVCTHPAYFGTFSKIKSEPYDEKESRAVFKEPKDIVLKPCNLLMDTSDSVVKFIEENLGLEVSRNGNEVRISISEIEAFLKRHGVGLFVEYVSRKMKVPVSHQEEISEKMHRLRMDIHNPSNQAKRK